MARPPKLRRHKGYWYTQAGSTAGVYFGRIDQLSFHDAQVLFREYLANITSKQSAGLIEQRSRDVAVAKLCDLHLLWVRSERSDALLKQRKSILNSWCNHLVGRQLAGHGQKIGKLCSSVITRLHAEQYLAYRCSQPTKKTKRPLGDKARRAHVIALKATWNWAADSVDDGGGGLIATACRPLAKLSRGFVQAKDLSETELPTDQEVEILLRWATVEPSLVRAGTGRWRPRDSDESTTAESRVFADLIRCYYGTGARTSELCLARVRDFMPRTGQVILGKHKRTRTQSTPTVRTIQVDEALAEVMRRNSAGKGPDEPLFTHSDDRPWNQNQVNVRLRAIKKLTVENNEPVRKHITPYSFRDLYISEMLMMGETPFKVAKLAGTSAREIERTYGHFFNDDLASSQARLAEAREQRRKQAVDDVASKTASVGCHT